MSTVACHGRPQSFAGRDTMSFFIASYKIPITHIPGGTSMRFIASAAFVALATIVAVPALAQLEDKPVPMDKAPFHIPVFQNDYIILLNVNIPPGRNTGYHIHHSDSVSVNLMPASQTNQNYGSDEVSAPGRGGGGRPGL